MNLVWSRLAIERAVAEAGFISQDKPGAAERWLEGLFSAVDRLATFPNSGHVVPELPRGKYRQLVYKSHRVVFTAEAGSVNILTIRRFKQRLKLSEFRSPAAA